MYKKVRRLKLDDDISVDTMTRLRSAPPLHIPVPTCQCFKKSVTFMGPTTWETLTPYTRQIIDLDAFKKLIRTRILVEFSELQSI